MRPPGAPTRNRKARRAAAKRQGKAVAAPAPGADLAQAQALHRAGRLDEAAAGYAAVLRAAPDNVAALALLGSIRAEQGTPADAARLLGRALALDPAKPSVLNLMGLALRDLGRPAEALARFDRALALKPGDAGLLLNRGAALRELRRLAEALAAFEAAVAAGGGGPAERERANALQFMGRQEAAVAAFDAALRHDPDDAAAILNRAISLRLLKRREEALAGFERAAELAPEAQQALGHRLHEAMQLCAWDRLDAYAEAVRAALKRGVAAARPFTLLALDSTPAERRRAAELFAADLLQQRPPARWRAGGRRHDRIRIGYFSADLREHATAHLAAELFERHDRRHFEVTAFSFGPDDGSAVRRRLEAGFERFLDVTGQSDLEIASIARKLEIDIAVDLKGYTENTRLGIFALGAAPVQASFLGYPGTLGADFIDYIVADPVVLPREHFDGYEEKVVHLPGCYQPNDGTHELAPPPSRAEAGLPDEGFVFCCFNNSFKLSPDAFTVWMRLLAAVDGSVLWLLEDNPGAGRNLRAEAARLGVAPERLVFAARVGHDAHLARQPLADLFLDTFHYNAHTTASDALRAGVPVLTRLGNAFAGRVAASLLTAVGLPELIARTTEEYETLALALAREPARLAALRARLAAGLGTAPLFDAGRFARHLEAAYAAMWQRHQAGLAPDHIALPAL